MLKNRRAGEGMDIMAPLRPGRHHHELPDRLLPRDQRRPRPGPHPGGSGGHVPGGEQRVGGAGGGDQIPGGPVPPAPLYQEEAAALIDQVEAFAAGIRAEHGTSLVWCSDEFYLLAGRALPEEDYYEEFTQLDNGVGMLRLLRQEFGRGWT